MQTRNGQIHNMDLVPPSHDRIFVAAVVVADFASAECATNIHLLASADSSRFKIPDIMTIS